MNKTFSDFVVFIEHVIAMLCANPGIKIDGQLSDYDRSRHLMRVLVTTNRGDVFQAQFAPECGPDLPGAEPTPFAALIKYHLAQQLTVADSIASSVHAAAWSADNARRNHSH